MLTKPVKDRRLTLVRKGRLLSFEPAVESRLAIKWADTAEERRAAFSVVHQEYLRLGYIQRPNPTGMHYGLHRVLPTSSTLILKKNDAVVATLTHVLDTDLYGLPMDKLYGRELDALRSRGRRLAELSALATRRDFCWQRLFMVLCRAAYRHALEKRVTDLCIMVNPRHAPFYKTVFLFEDLGPERFYPLVNAPAVALRADLETIADRLRAAYGHLPPEVNVYRFLTGSWQDATGWKEAHRTLGVPKPLQREEIYRFLCLEPCSLNDLTPTQQHNVAYLCPLPIRVH